MNNIYIHLYLKFSISLKCDYKEQTTEPVTVTLTAIVEITGIFISHYNHGITDINKCHLYSLPLWNYGSY